MKQQRKILFLALALIGLVGCTTPNKNKEKAALLLQLGTAELNQGNYPAALRDLLEAEQMNPEEAVVQNNLAIAYFVRNRYLEAEKHLLKAMEINPLYTDALNNLGRVHIELGKLDLAISELNRVINDLTYPTPEKGHTNLGLAYMRAKNYPRAKKAFVDAMKINRGFCPAQNYYGQTLFFEQDYTKAAEALDSAVQLCKNLDEAHYYSALSQDKLGRREKAMARMNEIVALYPSSPYLAKAKAYIQQNSKPDSEGVEAQ